MAYNSVGTPRFIIDYLTWYNSLGLIEKFYLWNADTSRSDDDIDVAKLIGLNPTSIVKAYSTSGNSTDGFNYVFYLKGESFSEKHFPVEDINVVGLFGHNLKTVIDDNPNLAYYIGFSDQGSGDDTEHPKWTFGEYEAGKEISINSNFSNNGINEGILKPSNDGWSLQSVSGISNDYTGFETNIHNINLIPRAVSNLNSIFTLGSCLIGRIFDMPHSPDLKLSISYETGTKEQTTRGGATLTNNMWEARKWGDLPAWGFDSHAANPVNVRYFNTAPKDRRVWDLSFSYLDKENTFPRYNSHTTLETTDAPSSNPDQYTLNGSDDFYSQVWNKVGNQHRFIFQPDNTVNEFAICKIDGNIKFTQVANGVYNIKLKIREVW